MFLDLHQGILEEFAEAGRLSYEDAVFAYAAWSEHHKEQHRKDCASYYGKKRLDPAWRARQSKRNAKYNANRPTTRAGRRAK